MDILHHIPANPENTKCFFFFLRLCQRYPSRFSVQLSQPPFSKVSKTTAPSKSCAYHTGPCLQSHGNRGMPTLDCRNSTGVANYPLELVVAKYGLLYNDQHSTRNQQRKEEKSMAFFMQNSPGIGKNSANH